MDVSMADVARYLRMNGEQPDGPLAERIASLAEAAGKAVRPARTWRRFPIVGMAVGDVPPAQIRIEGSLARHLDGCGAVYLACGTLGASVDAFHRRASAVSGADALILQAVAAAMIALFAGIWRLSARRSERACGASRHAAQGGGGAHVDFSPYSLEIGDSRDWRETRQRRKKG